MSRAAQFLVSGDGTTRVVEGGRPMSLDERTVAIFEDFQSGRLTRRQFVRRLAAAGFARGTISAFLSPGGGSTRPTAATAEGAGTPPPAPPPPPLPPPPPTPP